MKRTKPIFLSVRENRLFYKYLLSHMLSMVIPLFIILMVFRLSFVELVKNQSVEAEQKNLTLIMNEVDSLFLEMDRLKEQIQINKNLRPFRLLFNPYQGVTVIDELNNYTTVSSVPEGIILNYFADNNYYYSHCSTMEKGSLPYLSPLPSPLNWEDLLHKEKKTITILNNFNYMDKQLGDVLFISYPLYNVKSYGGLVIIVRLENILNKIPLITNRQVDLKVSLKEGGKDKTIFTASSGEWDRSQSLILEDVSLQTDLHYEMILSREFVFAPVNHVTQLILWVIGIILVLGAGTAVAGSLWNYRRLDQLKKQLESFPIDHKNLDILDYIGHSLTEISEQLNESSRARRESQVRRLLRGETVSSKDLSINGSNYAVAVLNLPSSLHQSRQELIDQLENLPRRNWMLHAVSDILTGRILLLLNYSDTFSEEEFQKEMNLFFSLIVTEIHADITMGLSRSCQNKAELSQRKEEAIHRGEMNFIHGTGRLYTYKDEEKGKKGQTPYPTALLQNYRRALVNKNSDDGETSIDNLIKYIGDNHLSLYMAKGIAYELISILLVSLSSDPGGIKNQNSLQTLNINQFETINDFGCYLKNFIRENINRNSEPANHPMTDYIKKTFCDVDFSLTRMGDAFDLNVPNLCHLFKEEVGMTILDYTSRLRMEESRKLLKAGKLNISEVAYQVGYANTNSFIRRFRQLNGLSPGEYRKTLNSSGKNR